MAFNMREFVFFGVLPGIERRKPVADCGAQRLEFKPSMNTWKRLDFCESCPEKSAGAEAVRSQIMVESRGNLNHTLQEYLFRVESLEPYLFPNLMRVIKMRRIKGFETSLEKLILLVGIHEPSVPAELRAAKRIIANLPPHRWQRRNSWALRDRHDSGFEFHPWTLPAL